MKESEVRELLARNKHVKVLKGSLESRFDPYLLSVKNMAASDDQQKDVSEHTESDGFDSQIERDYAALMTLQGLKWFREPDSIRLDDGSGERWMPDFLVHYPDGRREFHECKPFKWTPKEGRLGMSKMRRGARRVKELYGFPVVKVSRYKGVWEWEII